MPSARFLTGTHTDKLALDFSTKTRVVVNSELYQACFPEIKLRADQDTKEYFTNTAGGDRNTCTVGGKTPMGFHAQFLIVDDPLDPQGAMSEAELDNADKFMTDVIPSRKTDKAVSVTILVMQRIHFRDPTAVMLREAKKEGAAPIRHICLPGELYKGDDGKYQPANTNPPELAERYIDGLLDPQRLPRIVLKEYRARGELFFATQVEQNPYPPGGGMFKDTYFNQRQRAAPYHARRVRFWDRAATQSGGAYTAGVLMSMITDPLMFYVEHVVHGQWEPDERNAKMRATALADRSRYGPSDEPIILVEAEGGSSGRDAWKSVARALVGFPAFEQRVTGSKDVRAEPWSSQLAGGTVKIIDDGTWDVQNYIREHLLFRPEVGKRLGKFKDQVDASTGAFNWLIGNRAPTTGFKIMSGRLHRKSQLRIAVLTLEELSSYRDDEPALIMFVNDPLVAKEVITSEHQNEISRPELPLLGVPVDGAVRGEVVESPKIPSHGLDKLQDISYIQIADLDPAELQDRWLEPVEGYGKPPAELVMAREHGKKLWAFLTRKRPEQTQLWVFVGETRAPLSVALAVADACGLNRNVIYCQGRDLTKDDKPPNDHIYKCTKLTRETVVT